MNSGTWLARYTRTHTRIHTHTCTHMHARVYASPPPLPPLHTHTHTYTHTHKHTRIRTWRGQSRDVGMIWCAHTHTNTCTHILSLSHTHTHTYIHTCTHTHTRKCTHEHTHTHSKPIFLFSSNCISHHVCLFLYKNTRWFLYSYKNRTHVLCVASRIYYCIMHNHVHIYDQNASTCEFCHKVILLFLHFAFSTVCSRCTCVLCHYLL